MPRLLYAAAGASSFLSVVTRCAVGSIMRSLFNVVNEQLLLVFLTYTVAFMFGCWTWDLLNGKIYIVRHVFISLLCGLAIYPIHPPITYTIMLAVTFWSVILLAEVIMNEYREKKIRQLDMETSQRPNQRDKIVAHQESATYNKVRYHPVTICDTSVLEDPFWPEHISTIFTVEQKRRNMIWTTIRIWQVSLLNGGKKIAHQFHRFWPRTDGRSFSYRYARSNVITSFQSRGVVFILVRQIEDHAEDYALLLVYDTRFKKSAVYDMKLEEGTILMISITCLGRLVGVNGSIEGWRIRMLDSTYDSEAVNGAIVFRPCMINEIFDLREDVRQIMSEEISFGRFIHAPYLRSIRTSHGHIGLCAVSYWQPASPVMFYNEITSDFVLFRTFNDLTLMDARLGKYACLLNDHHFPDRHGWNCPVFTNPREAIRSAECGCVYRTEFRPSSLQYRAAKSIFHGNPRLRYQLDAEWFRQATGTPDMHGHFG